MRVLKIAGSLVLVLMLAFVGVGLMSSRVVLASEVEIDKPIEQVWRVFSDETRMQEWMDGLQRTESISGDALTVGGRSKLVFLEGEEEIEVIEEVTECKPGELYSFKMETDPFEGTTEIRFSAGENGTKLSAVTTMDGRNLVWCALLRLMKGAIADRNQGYYENLKRLIEAGDDELPAAEPASHDEAAEK